MEWSSEVWCSWWMLGLLGLCIGSFLNVVAHRMPRMLERGWLLEACYQFGDADGLQRAAGLSSEEAKDWVQRAEALYEKTEQQPPFNLMRPRSRCPQCGHMIAWHENLPVLGWLRLRGRCSACKTPISIRYPFVELLTGTLFAAIGWTIGAQPLALLWCAFAAVLLAASLVDWDTTLLPDDFTLPLLWAGLLVAWLGWTLPLGDAVLGAMLGYLSLWSVYWAFKWFTGTGEPFQIWHLSWWLRRAETGKEGMGYGDFKLLAALGAWFGPTMLLPIVLGAATLGAVVGLGMKFTGALREGRFVPFGPFLAGGGLVVLLAGAPRVLGWMGWA